jgi:type I restriction enzyme, S subunit
MSLSTIWPAERAKWLLQRQSRPPRPGDGVVTAFRDGQVTLRTNRRIEGFTEAVQEIGYQGIRKGDLVVHSMDGFAGAIGVSDSDGKASPVVHAYSVSDESDPRFIAYFLRAMALSGYIESLAKGIRERSTSFDVATLANLQLPCPSLDDQRRIADFLDAETAQTDALANVYKNIMRVLDERIQRLIDVHIDESGEPVPLKYFVRFREGPGIMAVDFRDEGVPLIRIAGLQDGSVTLKGANFLDRTMVAARWQQFRLRMGDYVISGSATMGAVSVVRDLAVVDAIPYTGLIILRPSKANVVMGYVAVALNSRQFMRQIDLLKAGATMQHFGPTHLAQILLPFPSCERQKAVASAIREVWDQAAKTKAAIDRQVSLLAERRQALITAAVTGGITV